MGKSDQCSVTESVTDRRNHDGSSYRFVMKIKEVVPVHKFQEFKCFGTNTLDGPLCLPRSIIPFVEDNKERSIRNCTSIRRQSP
ncbi:hypothetical protein EJD97_024245 [Solanum chilense]|uniref:Uncharacterized protein n=1 Tax=Solanum chilense TaxID=4083 RepID=A0A6N2AUZ8_SOLCI|nr:hypothetical protein EJD97_024245 [Solanum chilense]